MTKGEGKWSGWLIVGLLLFIGLGIWITDYRRSVVVASEYRFSLAASSEDGTVAFVSFDPVEKRVFALPFPRDLSITSRSVGEYSVGSLYKIGTYSEEGASFVQRKVQGFMRVPISGYLTLTPSGRSLERRLSRALLQSALSLRVHGTNLSRLDAFTLWVRLNRYTWRQAEEGELARAGVLEKRPQGGYLYRSDRLQQYVGTRLFDWGIGAAGTTIAIVNSSGIDGMGSDVADFAQNLGFDVVSVRTGKDVQDKSRMSVADPKKYMETTDILQRLLRLPAPVQGDTESYRAEIVIEVGKDSIELF